jgi:predicted anti-sigma-YlaC factor YlaD
MSCYKFQDHVSDYIDKNLDFSLQRELTEHLQSCESCRQLLNETQSLIKTLNTLPKLHCKAGFEDKLLARIHNEQLARSRKRELRWLPLSRNLSVAAAIVLLITASWLSVNWLNPNLQQPQVPISKLLEESGQKGQPLQKIMAPAEHQLSESKSEDDSSRAVQRSFQPRIQLVNEQE